MRSNGCYDLLVVGGGINGAAVAHLASKAGAKVILVEKGDWASGTSGKSTKLLHGGIRYLENFEFDLVAESLKERFIQYQAAGHLVKPLRFIVPVYQGKGRPLWMMKLGVWLYDLLSGKYSLGPHATLSAAQIKALVPGIKEQGLLGGVSYFDAQMDDARICLENVLMARTNGAEVANYTEVLEFIKENGRACGARVRDFRSGQTRDIKARQIIVTAGPWSDDFIRKDSPKTKAWLRPTKGAHVILRGALAKEAILLQNPKDSRIFFAIPFNGNTLIGTTDTDYDGPADNVEAQAKDIDYLLGQAKEVFPQLDCSVENIITAFAGLRPLVHEYKAPSKISRKHIIYLSSSGINYVMGGKYTTYRAIAREALAQLKYKIPDTDQFILYGSGSSHLDVGSIALRWGLEAEVVNHLIGLYGSKFEDVLKLTADDHALKTKICSCSLTIRAQVKYSIDVEMAHTTDDIYIRRLGLGYQYCPTRNCRQIIEEMVKAK